MNLLYHKQEKYFVVLYHDEQMIENEDTENKKDEFFIFRISYYLLQQLLKVV
jgi:hypothetical protein